MSYSPNFRGSTGNASKQLQSTYVNALGGTISKGTVLSINTSGQIFPIDVTSEVSVGALVGIANQDIPAAATGLVVSGGRLTNVTTSFSIGDAVYVGSDGLLTNVKPDLGSAGFVSGDFVIFIGVVVKNEFNPALQDIQLMISVVGQL